ncbi:hypothetical protein [[Phormidium ambiguum] IAM M-71]|nr:hypothetical protein [Phormidium ambiguum]
MLTTVGNLGLGKIQFWRSGSLQNIITHHPISGIDGQVFLPSNLVIGEW